MANSLLSCIFPLYNLKTLKSDSEKDDAEIQKYEIYLKNITEKKSMSRDMILFADPSM